MIARGRPAAGEKEKYLRRGDVFELKLGMRVYARIEERFKYDGVASRKKSTVDVTVGEKLRYEWRRPTELVNRFVEDVRELTGSKIKSSVIMREIIAATPIDVRTSAEFDTSELAGLYVVKSATVCGGGYGHGPNDYYPDGLRITARRIDDDKWRKNGEIDEGEHTVEFYQSGCFTAMIEPGKVAALNKKARRSNK